MLQIAAGLGAGVAEVWQIASGLLADVAEVPQIAPGSTLRAAEASQIASGFAAGVPKHVTFGTRTWQSRGIRGVRRQCGSGFGTWAKSSGKLSFLDGFGFKWDGSPLGRGIANALG